MMMDDDNDVSQCVVCWDFALMEYHIMNVMMLLLLRFNYAVWFAKTMLILTIVVTFGVMSPLIFVIGLYIDYSLSLCLSSRILYFTLYSSLIFRIHVFRICKLRVYVQPVHVVGS